MFYLINLTKELSLAPQNLGTDIKGLISRKIRELEGSVIGEHGYIVTIVEFNQQGKGIVENESGNVNFKVNYKAIVYKPFKDEILDAIPVYINEHGFFCRVGPLQIFVSQHMLENFEFDANEMIWEPTAKGETIELEKPIKLKILATQVNPNEITALGSLA